MIQIKTKSSVVNIFYLQELTLIPEKPHSDSVGSDRDIGTVSRQWGFLNHLGTLGQVNAGFMTSTQKTISVLSRMR